MDGRDRIAFVTGANRRMGLETARGLGELGVTVLLGSRDRTDGEKVASSLREQGIAHVDPVELDVRVLPSRRTIAW
jgi:NAD(P)-dependent dehydrogenase (short-subunit alcohol dehydrogenase family)